MRLMRYPKFCSCGLQNLVFLHSPAGRSSPNRLPFVIRFKLRYTPHVLGVNSFGLPRLALVDHFSAFWVFSFLVSIVIHVHWGSHLCGSAVASSRSVFCYLRLLDIMSTWLSCTSLSVWCFIGGVVCVLV